MNMCCLSVKLLSLVFEAPVSCLSLTIGHCEICAHSFVGGGVILKDTKVSRFCSIARDVYVGLTEHPTSRLSTHPFRYGTDKRFDFYQALRRPRNIASFSSRRGTVIGNEVWIGTRCFLSAGISIGDGAIICACSVVTKDVEPYSIVGGVPARVIRLRFDKVTIARLSAVRW